MADPRFYSRAGPFRLGALAQQIGAEPGSGVSPDLLLTDVAAIQTAGPSELSFYADKRHQDAVAQSKAAACLVRADWVAQIPAGTAILITPQPARAFAIAAALFYPVRREAPHLAESATVDPTAKLGRGVSLGPNVVIGARAEIGPRTVIGAGSVIGPGCMIGADASIAPQVTIAFALIGDRVIIHPGARIGQDGFGFVPGPDGHLKVPQLGRVIIQDDVEIGANTCIDRGAGSDTVIGEGTKIDNLVQIGHNVRVGRHCVFAGQVGISGSVVVGNFVALGGSVGIADHVTIGDGAAVGGFGGVMRDIPPGETQIGVPARPFKEFMRETATLIRLAKRKKTKDE